MRRKGLHLERGRDVEVLQNLSVRDVLQERPIITLSENDSLAHAAEIFMQTRRHGLPVLNDQHELVGILTLQDLDHNQSEKWPDLRVGEACTHEPLVTYPDETIGTALRHMSARGIGRLPVVERDNPRRLLAMLRRDDIIRAYDVALTRREAARHRAQQVRLDTFSGEGVKVEELIVQPGAACIGKPISQINWPRDCILASLRRKGQVMIPHGDTVLQSGDVLVAVTEGQSLEDIHQICRGNNLSNK